MLLFLQRVLHRPLILIGALLCFAAPSASHASQFTVNDLSLFASLAQGDDVFTDGTDLPANPLVDHFAVDLDNSSATMDVDFAWDEDAAGGRFLVESWLVGQGGATQPLAVDSVARIFITPAVPLTIRVRGEYGPDMPTAGLFSRYDFLVIGQSDQSLLVHEGFAFSTSAGPVLDLRSLDIEFILPPTQTWSLHATMNLQATGDQAFGVATGFFDIQIVPAPSSLALLLLGCPLLLRRTC